MPGRILDIPSIADEGIHARYLTEARGSLDPELWERAWAEGAAESLDEAIAYALSIG